MIAKKRNPAVGKYYDHDEAYMAKVAKGWQGWDERFDMCEIDMFTQEGLFAPDARVLEVGCGSGQAAISVAEMGCCVDAFDSSPTIILAAEESLAQASLEVQQRVRFYCEDLLSKPVFRFKEYDIVMDIHCFHCLVEPKHRDEFLRYAWDSLRPDGLLLSANMCGLPNTKELLETVMPGTNISRDGRRYFAEESEIKQSLAKADFEVSFWHRRRDPQDIDYLLLAARKSNQSR